MTFRKFVLAAAILLALFVSTVFSGYVLAVLWGWFVVTTFVAPSISVVQGIGISLVVTHLTFRVDDNIEVERDPLEKLGRAFAFSIGFSAIFLFYGWVVHMFMFM